MNNQDGAGFPKDNHCLQYNPAMNAINPLQNISRIAELKHRSQAANSSVKTAGDGLQNRIKRPRATSAADNSAQTSARRNLCWRALATTSSAFKPADSQQTM